MFHVINAASTALVSISIAGGTEVIFSNFGDGDSYIGNSGATVANGVDFGAYVEATAGFTVDGKAYHLDTIEVGAGMLWGENILFVSIHPDADGEPGDALATVAVVDQMKALGTDPGDFHPPVVADFGGMVLLEANQQYWVSLGSDPEDDSWVVWNHNDIGDEGPIGSRTDGGPWNTSFGIRPVFRVSGIVAGPGPGCPGDFNGDGVVDGADLATLLSAWGACADCDPPQNCPADLNGDCTVDGADLAILLSAWGDCD